MEESLIVLDAATVGYIRFDRELRFTFVNPAAAVLLGRDPASLAGMRLLDLPAAGGPIEAACRRVLAGHDVVAIEHYFEPQQRWYSVTVIPDPGGGLVAQFSEITRRKQIEDALRKSEEKFSKAFDCSPAPMCIVDIDANARFLGVNNAFERISGYRAAEVVGRTSTEIGLYEDLRVLDESRRLFLEQGGYRELEVRVRRKDGEILTALISAEQIQLGGRLCAIAVAQDVTEYRRAEQALRESEEFFRRLFEVESDALLLVEQESGRLLEANTAACRLYGYTRDELRTMNRVDLSAEPAETLRVTLQMEEFIPLRWHRKKDGTVFAVEISGTYFDLRGRKLFISAIRDITHRRLMEEALRKSEEKFSRAFQSNPAAISISDLASQSILELNDTFEEITGYRRNEAIGKSWSEVVCWESPADYEKAIARLTAEGKLRNLEFGFRKKDGAAARGLLCAELIDIDCQRRMIATFVDITERIQLEYQLRQSQKLQSVGRLAGGVAHDFNNLLTIILGYCDFILNGTRPADPIHTCAEEIRGAGEHAAALTSQLLAFSRKQVIEPRPLDLNTIVADAGRMLNRLIGEDIELAMTLDPQLPLILADPDQMRQIILNLAVNARDAIQNGGRIEISTRSISLDERAAAAIPDAAPGNYVVMTVTDSGIGMDEKTQQAIFEPFFTTKAAGRGTGLGLPTVYGIVRQNGGWIDVRSQVGRGSSFSIHLPRLEATLLPAETALEEPRMAGRGETILVVEDDPDVRKLTRAFLESAGYRVLEAANGAEAFAIERENAGEIHLLLTDVILPGMNGKALADKLRTLRPEIKVLFTSGYTFDVISSRGVLDPSLAYLPKPFSRDSLTAKVLEVLASPTNTLPAKPQD